MDPTRNCLKPYSINNFRDLHTDVKHSAKRKRYYRLDEENWDKPYQQNLREALFDEPVNKRFCLYDLRSETADRKLKGTHPFDKPTAVRKPQSQTLDKVICTLTGTRNTDLPDDFYTSCLAAKGEFFSFIDGSHLITVKGQTIVFDESLPFNVTAIEINRDGLNYIGDDTGVCWGLDDGRPWRCLEPQAAGKITTMTLEQNILYAANEKFGVSIRSLNDKEIRNIRFPEQDSVCRILAPVKDDHKIVVGSNDNKVSVYDDRNLSHPLFLYHGHASAVRALARNPFDQREIVSGGGVFDRTLRIWDLNTGEDKSVFEMNSQFCNVFWNKWGGTEYITTVNGRTLHNDFNSDADFATVVSQSSISIFKVKDVGLEHTKHLDLGKTCRPFHSIFRDNNPHTLMLGGKGYLDSWTIRPLLRRDTFGKSAPPTIR